jgi:hypothetical protein
MYSHSRRHAFQHRHIVQVSGYLHTCSPHSEGKISRYQLNRMHGGPSGPRLPEAKREIADPAGNRIPVIQHVTTDAFVTVAICIGLLKSGPEGSTLLAVKRESSGATSGLQTTVAPHRDRSSRRLYLWAEGSLPLCPRLRKLHVPSHAVGNRSADINTCFVQGKFHVRSLDLPSNILTGFSHKVHRPSRKILHYYLK